MERWRKHLATRSDDAPQVRFGSARVPDCQIARGVEWQGGALVQIIRASEMGFCFGVRRAVEMMEDAVRNRGDLVSLGSVVHNPQVVDKLRNEGLEVISDVSQ